MIAIVVLAGAAAAAVALTGRSGAGARPAEPAVAACTSAVRGAAPAAGAVTAGGFTRRVIHTPPQADGYDAWVGAWTMPSDRLMVAFTEAVGPVDPAQRPAAPEALKRRLGVDGLSPEHDFWGLEESVEYLTSDDGGETWDRFRSDPFKSVYPHAYAAAPTIGLNDGSILRRVNGSDLLNDPSVPHTAFLQRLEPGADAWGPPQVLMDPQQYTYQLSRFVRLRDGCLLALGQFWAAPAGTGPAQLRETAVDHLMLVSADEGRTWRRNPVAIPEGAYVSPNEWDVAELPDGDLLALFRTRTSERSSVPVRRQGRLVREGDGWVLTDVRDAPFPHSGHPELLSTREGVVLSIASTGIDATTDAGRTWQPLNGVTPPRYYPVSLQAPDGTIDVFSHAGSDHGYGEVPGRIIMDSFRIDP